MRTKQINCCDKNKFIAEIMYIICDLRKGCAISIAWQHSSQLYRTCSSTRLVMAKPYVGQCNTLLNRRSNDCVLRVGPMLLFLTAAKKVL